jgi:aminopeptidase N
MDLYFARHDGQAVTCDDFVAAIADANGRDLSVFSRWYAQAGTPRVEARGAWDASRRAWTLTLRQATPATPGQSEKLPLHIPFAIGLLGPDGRDLPLRLDGEPAAPLSEAVAPEAQAAGAITRVLDLAQAEQRFVFVDLPAEPVPSLLRDFSAPVVVDYPFDDARLAFLLAHDADPFNRWEASQRLGTAAVLGALVGAGEATLETLADGWARVLDDATLEPAYRALVLTCLRRLRGRAAARGRSARGARRARDRVAACWARASRRAGRPRSRPTPRRPYSTAVSAGKRRSRTGAVVPGGAGRGDAATAALARQAQHAPSIYSRPRQHDRPPGALARCWCAARRCATARSPRSSKSCATSRLAMNKTVVLAAGHDARIACDPPVPTACTALLSQSAVSLRNTERVRALVGSVFCKRQETSDRVPSPRTARGSLWDRCTCWRRIRSYPHMWPRGWRAALRSLAQVPARSPRADAGALA